MLDLNDLRIFERVAALRSFSAGARALQVPKSGVSRSIQRLESELGTALFQRTTRNVVRTEAGDALYRRCIELLAGINDAIEYVSGISQGLRGSLVVSAGIGAGPNILADILPEFSLKYPDVAVTVDLSSRQEDLVLSGIDVAIRMGPLRDSQLIATKLGQMRGYLCAAPTYLARRGVPLEIEDLKDHDLIAMPVPGGQPKVWPFTRGKEKMSLEQQPHITINCAVSIHRLVVNGAGISNVAGYMSGPSFQDGSLVRLLPEWKLPPVDVHAVFPNHREMSPIVRAFVDFLKDSSRPGHAWQNDPLDA